MSESKIYVGNLPFNIGFAELKEQFAKFGEVAEATVITNKFSGRSKGFGFVTFTDSTSAEKAIAEMDGKDFGGRQITVNAAKPMEERPPRDDRRERGPRRERSFEDDE